MAAIIFSLVSTALLIVPFAADSAEPEVVVAEGETLVVRVDNVPRDNEYQRVRAAAQIAMRVARKTGYPVALRFSSREYRIEIPDDKNTLLDIANVQDLTLDGNGANFVMNRAVNFVTVRKASDVTIRDFSVDYNPLPFTQGVILEADAAALFITVELDEGYASLDDPRFQSSGVLWGFIKDRDTPGMPKRGARNVQSIDKEKRWKKIGPRTFRIYLAFWPERNNIEPGDRYVQAISAGRNLLQSYFSENITFSGINVYSHPGATFYTNNTDSLTIVNNNIMIKPDTNRWHSVSRDGAIISNCRNGLTFHGNRFEANGDDGLNIHGTGVDIDEQVDSRTLKLTQFAHPDRVAALLGRWRQGDLVRILDDRLAQPVYSGRVVDIEASDGDAVKVTLDTELPQFQSELKHQLVFNDATMCPGTEITQNTFRFGRRHPLLLLSNNVLVADNLFDRNAAGGVRASRRTLMKRGYLGGWTTNATIERNVFADTFVQQIGSERTSTSIIDLSLDRTHDGEKSKGIASSGIRIMENVFQDVGGGISAVLIDNASDVYVGGNTIDDELTVEDVFEVGDQVRNVSIQPGDVNNETGHVE